METIRCGIQKINLNTDLNEGGLRHLKQASDEDFRRQVQGAGGEMNTKRMNLQQTIQTGVDGWKEVLKYYIKLFGGENRA